MAPNTPSILPRNSILLKLEMSGLVSALKFGCKNKKNLKKRLAGLSEGVPSDPTIKDWSW